MPRNYPLSLEVGAITIIIYASILTYLKLTITQCGFLLKAFFQQLSVYSPIFIESYYS